MINTLIFCDDNHCNIANGQTVISIGADNMSGAIFVLSKKMAMQSIVEPQLSEQLCAISILKVFR